MHCLICRWESVETKDFIALDFALDKKVCKNCAFALGRKAKDELLAGVKVHQPEKGILPVDIKPFFHGHQKVQDPDGPPDSMI